jgi:hypothetical protein
MMKKTYKPYKAAAVIAACRYYDLRMRTKTAGGKYDADRRGDVCIRYGNLVCRAET